MQFNPVTMLLLAVLPFGASAVEIETARVEKMTVARTYKLDGVVEAVQKTTVSAQISGQVEAILYDIDDTVEKGAVIIRLKDREPAARLKQATAARQEAEARVKEAEDEYARIKGVFEKAAVSKQALDSAEAGLKAARAKLEAANAGLEQSQEQLEYTRVRAPYAGIVTERHIEVGENAVPGKPLMTGLSLEHLRVNVDVPQSMINAVRNANSVHVVTPEYNRVHVVERTVFPYADQASHTFRVRLDLPESSPHLYPGMFVKAAFEIGSDSALVVPNGAIVQRSEITGVYVLHNGRPGLRAIRRGRDLGDGRSIVLSGLVEGEEVALDPVQAAGFAGGR